MIFRAAISFIPTHRLAFLHRNGLLRGETGLYMQFLHQNGRFHGEIPYFYYFCEDMEENIIPVERHPLEPFLPEGAKVLMLGSFPPSRKRWSMDFFYPNWINDMWRIVGHVFYGDRDHFVAGTSAISETENRISHAGSARSGKQSEKRFDKDRIVEFCTSRGIALYDTACEVRRLQDNASDKFLEVVKATDLKALLERIPECRAIVTTGQKATDVICEVFGCEEPSVGGYIECSFDTFLHPIPGNSEVSSAVSQEKCSRSLRFWRMPSSSRAYPLALEKKAEYYRRMFESEGLTSHVI